MQKNKIQHGHIGWWLICIVGFAIGLLWYWPVGLISVAVAAFASESFLAIALGLILDIAYGPLLNALFLPLPFTALAVALVALRQSVGVYFFQSERELRI